MLSATDVMGIRASALCAIDLAKFYGVSIGTIRDIRAGRRGRLLLRRLSADLAPDEIARHFVYEIARVIKQYRAAAQQARIAAKEPQT